MSHQNKCFVFNVTTFFFSYSHKNYSARGRGGYKKILTNIKTVQNQYKRNEYILNGPLQYGAWVLQG